MRRVMRFITLLMFITPTFAQTSQSLDTLHAAIKTYISQHLHYPHPEEVRITTDPIDNRLQLKACSDEQLELFNPYNAPFSGNLTIGIRCQEPDAHWTLYVPAHINIQKQVISAVNPILRGALIRESDITFTSMDINQLKHGYYTQAQEVIGFVAKQSINQGSPITPALLEKPVLIKKGMHVSIQSLSDMISVSIPGIAMEDGALHERIRVQNTQSKRQLDAEIINGKTVQVRL